MPRAVTLDHLRDAATLGLFLGPGPVVATCLPAGFPGEIEPAGDPSGGIGSILLFTGPPGPIPGLARGGSIPDGVASGHSDHTGSDAAQTAVLRPLLAACHRALRRDGRIAVAVENRRHQVFRRLLARVAGTPPAVAAPVTGARASLGDVMDALRDAGFVNITVFSVSPSIGDPRDIRPLACAVTASGTGRGSLARLRARGATWLAPGYLVTACTAGPGGASLLDGIVACLERSLGGRNQAVRWRIGRVAGSAKEKSIAFAVAGEAQIVIRLPHSAAAQVVETMAYGMLADLKGNAGIAGRVPDPVLSGSVGGQPFFAERRVAGVPLTGVLKHGNRAAYVREADAFLRALNPDLASSKARPVEGDLAATLVQPMLDRVLACLRDAALRRSTQSLFEECLRGAASRVGIVHGDFGISNILVADGRITGVIDWEDALRAAPPVLDAFNYLDSAHRHSGRNLTLVDSIPLLADGNWPVAEEFDFLREFFRFCGIDFRFRRGFALLYWLYHAGPQLNFSAGDETLGRRVEDVLGQFLH